MYTNLSDRLHVFRLRMHVSKKSSAFSILILFTANQEKLLREMCLVKTFTQSLKEKGVFYLGEVDRRSQDSGKV